mmetsp:Transcript_66147/g.123437  ORF Transcript_66147/g.123437 Transcript_66147/m.123437 type:complete len:277 (-) Transcript_66147:147-977(-)
MGNAVRTAFHCDKTSTRGTPILDERDLDEEEEEATQGQIYAVISANDYPGTKNELLGCFQDGKNMWHLIRKCGVPDSNITTLLDEENTIEALKGALTTRLQQCGPDDTFVFYYSGHGTRVEDVSGDEEDGQDEALVMDDGCIIDDDLAELFLANSDEQTRILMIADCCHSASLLDFDSNSDWRGRRAVSISGCADHQVSLDTHGGGVLTGSLLHVVQDGDVDDATIAEIFNKALDMQEKHYSWSDSMDLSCQWAPGHGANKHRWPLVPRSRYNFKR